MKKLFWAFVVFLIIGLVFISYRIRLLERLALNFNQSPNGKSWQNEVDKQKQIYTDLKDIIFIGDSHIEQCEWQEVFPDFKIGNRGIGGETSGALLARLDYGVLPGTKTVVIQIGVNDILSDLEPELVVENYKLIIKHLRKKDCEIVLTLPFFTRYYSEKNEKIEKLNEALSALFNHEKIVFINLNEKIAPEGLLLLKFSSDGVHLNSDGYLLWIKELRDVLK